MPDHQTCNIAAAIDRMAGSQPYRPAIIYPHGRDASGRVSYTLYTFRQLAEASGEIAAGLEAAGIRRGMRTVLMVTPSLEFFALTFALFRAGIVPVMIDPGIDRRALKQCLAEAEPEAFIGIPKAHVGRMLFGWGKDTIRHNVTVGRKGPWGGVTLSHIRELGRGKTFTTADTRADEVAAVLFTSGSTGVPKGAVYRHGNFTAQVEMLRQTYGMQPGEVNLPTFPLFALFDPALGMTSVIPDMDATRPADVDPQKIFEAVENFGITQMFGSPALLNTISRYGVAHGVTLPTLKRVLSAGAPVPPVVLERMAQMLPPDAQIYTPYGATETLPVASIGSHEILSEARAITDSGGGTCIGKPVEGVEVFIISITDDPIPAWDESLMLPDGEVGELVVKSPTVTQAYYNRPQQTALAKIALPDGTIMHRMGDLVRRDEKGRLWFCGRKSHRVELGDTTLFTVPVEAVFNTHPLVYRTALVGVGEPGAQKPILCIELEKDAAGADHSTISAELLDIGAAHAHTRGIRTFLFHPSFPVDIRHNSKIFREKLRVWAAEQQAR